MEREATIWSGSAFNCVSRSNEITLLPSHYGTYDAICNNGDIVGRSLSGEGNNYTSQLNITVTPDTAGKTVVCVSSNEITVTPIFSTVIPTITGLKPYKANQRFACLLNIRFIIIISLQAWLYHRAPWESVMLTCH